MAQSLQNKGYYYSPQVEEYQLGTDELDEVECPVCSGSGEEEFDFEGVTTYESCSNCLGSGVFYVKSD